MLTDLYNRTINWSLRPFDSSMSASGWLAFIGFLMIAFIFWGMVIGMLKKHLPDG